MDNYIRLGTFAYLILVAGYIVWGMLRLRKLKPKRLPDEVFNIPERTPVSLFDPAPVISPVRTWSEQRKEWVMIHTKDCMCAYCHFPLPLDGDLYRERAKRVFHTDDPTPSQRDFAKRVTWAQNYTGVWVESDTEHDTE